VRLLPILLLAAAAAGRIVALLVQRPNGRRFVPLRIP